MEACLKGSSGLRCEPFVDQAPELLTIAMPIGG
jgi:hypothetical protein